MTKKLLTLMSFGLLLLSGSALASVLTNKVQTINSANTLNGESAQDIINKIKNKYLQIPGSYDYEDLQNPTTLFGMRHGIIFTNRNITVKEANTMTFSRVSGSLVVTSTVGATKASVGLEFATLPAPVRSVGNIVDQGNVMLFTWWVDTHFLDYYYIKHEAAAQIMNYVDYYIDKSSISYYNALNDYTHGGTTYAQKGTLIGSALTPNIISTMVAKPWPYQIVGVQGQVSYNPGTKKTTVSINGIF